MCLLTWVEMLGFWQAPLILPQVSTPVPSSPPKMVDLFSQDWRVPGLILQMPSFFSSCTHSMGKVIQTCGFNCHHELMTPKLYVLPRLLWTLGSLPYFAFPLWYLKTLKLNVSKVTPAFSANLLFSLHSFSAKDNSFFPSAQSKNFGALLDCFYFFSHPTFDSSPDSVDSSLIMYPDSDPSRLLPCSTPSFPRVALTWSPCFYCPISSLFLHQLDDPVPEWARPRTLPEVNPPRAPVAVGVEAEVSPWPMKSFAIWSPVVSSSLLSLPYSAMATLFSLLSL